MPFYLRAHLGPIGWSTRLRGGQRRQQDPGAGLLVGVLLLLFLFGWMIWAIVRWWYVSLPILGTLAILIGTFAIAVRIADRREERRPLDGAVAEDIGGPLHVAPQPVVGPTALIVLQEMPSRPFNWRDHVTMRDVRDGQPYYELRAVSEEEAEKMRCAMEAEGWTVAVQRFTGH